MLRLVWVVSGSPSGRPVLAVVSVGLEFREGRSAGGRRGSVPVTCSVSHHVPTVAGPCFVHSWVQTRDRVSNEVQVQDLPTYGDHTLTDQIMSTETVPGLSWEPDPGSPHSWDHSLSDPIMGTETGPSLS